MLVDFGLAVQFSGELSREILDVEAEPSGTLLYMAPEQLHGELLDARADLYSLGCILYELLCGRPPFSGRSAATLVQAHLEEAPEPPSKLVPGLPDALDALVLRLLAKSPRQRLGHADDVAAALAALGAESGSEGPEARSYLYRPGLAGRDKVLRELESRLEGLESGSAEPGGGVVLLGGESGVGKSRVALELGRRAERRGLCVLAGECLPADLSEQARSRGVAGPLHPLRKPLQFIADRCRGRGLEETEHLLGRRGKLLALYEPALAGLPGQEAYAEPAGAQALASLPAEAARLRLYSHLTETFSALAEDSETLLLLDDLQWADELTLEWLEHLLRTRRLAARPLLILGTYRTEETAAAPASPLARLLETPGTLRLRLGRLEHEAVGRIVSDMLALEPPPEAFVRFLDRQSEGNPFFVAEYLRAAIAERVLFRSDGLWQAARQGAEAASESLYEALPLPRSLRETVGRRLATLTAGAQRLLESAAVLGREMHEPLLLAVARLDADAALEPLQELRVREVLDESTAGRLRFAHDKLREVAYERIGLEARRALHRAAAEAIVEARQAAPVLARDEPLAALGHHWEQAGVPEPARACYLAAARAARNRYALGNAEELYRAYLRLIEQESAESIEARIEAGYEVLYPRGKMDEARVLLEQALALARQAGERRLETSALGNLGWLRNEQGQLEEARELYEQGLAVARQAGDRLGEGTALNRLGVLRKNQGRWQEAWTYYEEAIAVARQIADRRLEEVALGNLGWLLGQQGHLEEAWTLYEQGLAITRQTGDRMDEGLMLSRMGVLRAFQRQVEEAQALYEQAIDLQREIGNRRAEGRTLGNLAVLCHDQGQLEKAWTLFEQALAAQRQVSDRPAEVLTLGHLGLVRHAQGRLDEARALHEQALAAARQIGDRPGEGTTLGYLGDLLGEQGLVDEALRLSTEALDFHREAGNRRLEGWVLCVQARQRRRTSPHPGGALELARAAEGILRSAFRDLLPLAMAERGHALLASGEPAAAELQEVCALVGELGHRGKASEVGRALARLERAQSAFEAGRPLFRGELWEDLPEGVRRWLLESGQAGQAGAGPQAPAPG